jgi:hypothetical protein
MQRIICVFIFLSQTCFSQGKFAGEFKNVIGLIFSADIPLVKGFVYKQGVVISDTGAPFTVTINVYTKGKISIVTLEKLVDLKNNSHAILELLKIEDVPKNHEIRITGCTSKGLNPDDKIVAIVNPGGKQKIKFIKEAFVLKDIRFEKMNPKTVKCINEI